MQEYRDHIAECQGIAAPAANENPPNPNADRNGNPPIPNMDRNGEKRPMAAAVVEEEARKRARMPEERVFQAAVLSNGKFFFN